METIPRSMENDIKEFAYRSTPLYVSTAYDVYSKNFCTVNVGKALPPAMGLVRYGSEVDVGVGIADVRSPKDENPGTLSLQTSGLSDTSESVPAFPSRNILQPYSPSLVGWFSTFRSVPEDTTHLLNGKVGTDSNLLVKFIKLQMRQKPFEPLFGHATLYAIVDEEIHRISESFHFDATQEALRRYYSNCYANMEGENGGRVLQNNPAKVVDYSGSCVNVADASGDRTHLHMCHATVPEELRGKDLYLVVQISKFMSSDCTVATAPYFPRAIAPDPPKQKEACERLSRYRQPVSIGVLRLCEDSGKLTPSIGNGEYLIPLYCQKTCLSDQQIQGVSSVSPLPRLTLRSTLLNLHLCDCDLRMLTLFTTSTFTFTTTFTSAVDKRNVPGGRCHPVCAQPGPAGHGNAPRRARPRQGGTGAPLPLLAAGCDTVWSMWAVAVRVLYAFARIFYCVFFESWVCDLC